MDLVEFENVSMRYGEEGPMAIENISLSVRENEFVAVVAPPAAASPP